MTSKFTREELLNIIETDHVQCGEASALARMALAAMDSEPVATLDVQSRRPDGNKFALVFSSAAHKLPDDVYFLYRHAQQSVVQKIMARLAYLLDEDQFHNIESMVLAAATQPAAAVPDDVLDALQKVARIHLDLNDFDGDRRGIADCLGDAEEALIEVVKRRAAMLNGGKP
ncbi:hypothetical protein [Klebsiella michiganensis]|uniref:hypothetical protein n=1 Tax=Klebsiella michiganensis TaxID=1134687 RepID=UPI0031334CFF